MYSELASFTGGKTEDFATSNLADEQQWVADLQLKLQVSVSMNVSRDCDTAAVVSEI